MKNKILLFFSFLSIGYNFQAFSQKTYISIEKVKTELQIDSSSILLKVKDRNNINEILNTLKKQNIPNKLLPIGSDVFILTDNKISNIKSLNIPNIDFKQWVYYADGNPPYYFNGDLLLRLKEDIKIERITNLVHDKLELKKKLSSGTYIFKVLDGSKVLEISNKIDESGLVIWSQPDFLAHIEKSITPTDPMYSQQYYLNNTGQYGGTAGIDINAPEAWDITTGCNNIRIAVLDDGVENHNDLNGRVLNGYTDLDASGLGRPSDICSEVFPGSGVFQRVGHGMACTGIIAASHNSIGIAGIAPNALIYPINIFHGGETIGNLVTSLRGYCQTRLA